MYDIDKKYIFTHPPKCAGASVEKALGLRNLNRRSKKFKTYKKLLHQPLNDHIKIIQSYGLNWKDFFIFSVVRNPWDRAVSRFFFLKTHINKYKNTTICFEDYIRDCYKDFLIDGEHGHHSIKEFMYFQDEYSVDYVIRQENFEAGLQKVMEKLGVSNYELHHLDQNTIRPSKDYKSFYTKETKNMVTEMAKDSIEIFSYKF